MSILETVVALAVIIAVVYLVKSKPQGGQIRALADPAAPDTPKSFTAKVAALPAWWASLTGRFKWLRGWPRMIALSALSAALLVGVLAMFGTLDKALTVAKDVFVATTGLIGNGLIVLIAVYVTRRIMLQGIDFIARLNECDAKTQAWIVVAVSGIVAYILK